MQLCMSSVIYAERPTGILNNIFLISITYFSHKASIKSGEIIYLNYSSNLITLLNNHFLKNAFLVGLRWKTSTRGNQTSSSWPVCGFILTSYFVCWCKITPLSTATVYTFLIKVTICLSKLPCLKHNRWPKVLGSVSSSSSKNPSGQG